MISTVISNNCTGAAVLNHLGMEFMSPTVNLQILPEEFPKFCKDIRTYMAADLREYKNVSTKHSAMLYKMFGGIPNMPLGLVKDVMVCFQHYDTFGEAREAWDRRKYRVRYDEIGYLFHARGVEYKEELENFIRLDLPHSLAIAEGFSCEGAVRFDPPEGGNAFSAVNGKVAIVWAYDWRRWIE